MQWHGYWSANLSGYAARRNHIRTLLTPTLDTLVRQQAGTSLTDPGGGLATWADLDGRVAGLATELSGATSRDDLQDVGRRAREVLIDCARLLADHALVPAGVPVPKAADAKAWLGLFLGAWDLAQKVTHGDVDRLDAFAAAQATILVVRTLQELARLSQLQSASPSSVIVGAPF